VLLQSTLIGDMKTRIVVTEHTCQPPKGKKQMQLTSLANRFTETALCSDDKLSTAALMLQMPLGTCSFATEQADGSVNAKLFCYRANISMIYLHC
jgi:hypothetical protein